MKTELKKSILKFGYGINYKYEGMLAHSCDKFYVVTKFILPTIDDLKFSKTKYSEQCKHLQKEKGHTNKAKNHILDFIQHCRKIRPFLQNYKDQTNSFNYTTYNILKKKQEIGLILPKYIGRKVWY